MDKTLEYYLGLPWSYNIRWDDEDVCYIASIDELKGCMSCGETLSEATAMIQDALKSYISCALQYGDSIPEPVRLHDFKGKIAYRTTQQQHYEAFKAAKELGISLNAYIDGAVNARLAGRV